MKTSTAFVVCILIALAIGVYVLKVYPSMPDRIPTHWDIHGKIDQYGSKTTLFIWAGLPLISVVLLVLLPWLSPKNFSIESFRHTFNYIMAIVGTMMGYIGFVVTYGTANPHLDMTKALISGIMLFVGLLGNSMGKVQRNFYVGIRTPWTLASDKVWVATHRLGARLMTSAGIAGAILVWLNVPLAIVFTVFIAMVLYPVLFSLLYYKRLDRTGSV